MRFLLLVPIRVYQYAISPMMASHCRHYPTCSAYALEAIEYHGALKGLFLATRRLLRCHPWAEGGYDPVPGCAESTPLSPDCRDQQGRCKQTATHQTTH